MPDKIFELYDRVETFVMFVGHGRSGHSIVGSLLDAHPEVIIAHESNILGNMKSFQNPKWALNVQKHLLFYRLHKNSEFNAMFSRHAKTSIIDSSEGEHTYIYHVPGQWQGTYRNVLRVSCFTSSNLVAVCISVFCLVCLHSWLYLYYLVICICTGPCLVVDLVLISIFVFVFVFILVSVFVFLLVFVFVFLLVIVFAFVVVVVVVFVMVVVVGSCLVVVVFLDVCMGA